MSAVLRTLSDLQDAISNEFAWRKRELSGLKSLVLSSQSPLRQELHIRTAIPLLYAHWEGFIKNTGTLYIQFVSRQQLRHRELAPCFLAVAIGSMVHDAGQTSKIQPCLDLVRFFRDEVEVRSNLAWRSIIQTESNLSSKVLREIVSTLGLDYLRFATKEKLLDEKLLANRNTIAHGQYLAIKTDDYIEIHDEIFVMMQDFYNQVDNASSMHAYRAEDGQ